MIAQSNLNIGQNSHSYRYPDRVLENFALMTRIIGGRRYYEIFMSNFHGIFPHIRTIDKKLETFQEPIIEGKVYVQELKSYLLLNNCPLEVSLSADATSLIPKVEYNVKLNSMIGFSRPVKENGLPGAEESICDGVARIINAFDKLDKATNVLIIMAQPMSDAVPPMRICSFGTNNKYTAVDVHNRLSTISAALTEIGIRIQHIPLTAIQGSSR